MDMIRSGVGWLNNQRRNYLSTEVTYSRGNLTFDVLATFGETTYELTDESGNAVKAKGVDFIISRSDFDLLVEPKTGDQITVKTGNDQGEIYEVLQLIGSPCYRPHGPHGFAFRIHTKLVGPCEI